MISGNNTSLLLWYAVKLWSANCNQSIYTLDTKANVCSVQFHPTNRFYLAFGSAGESVCTDSENPCLGVYLNTDHSIHYMDMRKPQAPLRQLKGHRKAVSYVQFMSNCEVVSAYVLCSVVGALGEFVLLNSGQLTAS